MSKSTSLPKIAMLGEALTWIQVRLHICDPFQTSFVPELVALSCLGLKLHMMMIMKALLSLYNIESSTINEAQSVKELCVFENPASSWLLFIQYASFFDHSTSTMVTAGPAPGEFTSDRAKWWLFGKLMTSSRDGRRYGCKGLRG